MNLDINTIIIIVISCLIAGVVSKLLMLTAKAALHIILFLLILYTLLTWFQVV